MSLYFPNYYHIIVAQYNNMYERPSCKKLKLSDPFPFSVNTVSAPVKCVSEVINSVHIFRTIKNTFVYIHT